MFAIVFGAAKTRVVWLLDGEKKFDNNVEPFRQNTGVWQTDGRKSCDSMDRTIRTFIHH